MLKLARFDDKARDVWIFAKHIVAITDDHESTYVWTASKNFRVKETPEQILAMPEMKAEVDRALYDAYPPMVVPGVTEWKR